MGVAGLSFLLKNKPFLAIFKENACCILSIIMLKYVKLWAKAHKFFV